MIDCGRSSELHTPQPGRQLSRHPVPDPVRSPAQFCTTIPMPHHDGGLLCGLSHLAECPIKFSPSQMCTCPLRRMPAIRRSFARSTPNCCPRRVCLCRRGCVILGATFPRAAEAASWPRAKSHHSKFKYQMKFLKDLRERLSRTRFPDEVPDTGWEYGTNLAYLKQLVEYWRSHYDWRAHEAEINRFAQFRTEIDGLGIHYIHEPGRGPNPKPLLLIARMARLDLRIHAHHSDAHRSRRSRWRPQSFVHGDRAVAARLRLLRPSAHARDEYPVDRGTLPPVDDRRARLQSLLRAGRRLGRRRHLAPGRGPRRPALWHPSQPAFRRRAPRPFVRAHRRGESFLADMDHFRREETGYQSIQGTKPQTLAYGLNDSPAGLAAWIVEKFRTWSDCGGDVERFSKDQLLTNIMIYWITQSINSSTRLYYESRHHPWRPDTNQAHRNADRRRDFPARASETPAGVGRTRVQHPALDRDAGGGTLRRDGGAETPRRRHPRLFQHDEIAAQHRAGRVRAAKGRVSHRRAGRSKNYSGSGKRRVRAARQRSERRHTAARRTITITGAGEGGRRHPRRRISGIRAVGHIAIWRVAIRRIPVRRVAH